MNKMISIRSIFMAVSSLLGAGPANNFEADRQDRQPKMTAVEREGCCDLASDRGGYWDMSSLNGFPNWPPSKAVAMHYDPLKSMTPLKNQINSIAPLGLG